MFMIRHISLDFVLFCKSGLAHGPSGANSTDPVFSALCLKSGDIERKELLQGSWACGDVDAEASHQVQMPGLRLRVAGLLRHPGVGALLHLNRYQADQACFLRFLGLFLLPGSSDLASS